MLFKKNNFLSKHKLAERAFQRAVAVVTSKDIKKHSSHIKTAARGLMSGD